MRGRPATGRRVSMASFVRLSSISTACIGFGESALSGLGLERPGEVTLAMDIGRAKIAGFDARTIAARLKLDAGGLAIERLSIGDLGDTAFVATGRIQTQSSPGGSITVNLDSRDLSGIQALSERFAPALAGPLRSLAARQKTATLQASVSMESSGTDGASGKIGLTGKIGAIRVNVSASATGKREAFMVTDLGALAGADVHIDGRFESDGSGPLLGLLGLDRSIAADSKPARFDVSANGPLGRELRFEGKLTAGPIDAGGKGTLRLVSDQPATLDFDQFAGMIGGNNVQGRGTLRFDDVLSIDGSIEAESLDAPAVVAAAIGMPSRSGRGGAGWSPDPIVWSAAGLNGRIAFKAQRAVFAPWLVAQGFSGAVRFNGPEILFEDIAGELGKGRLDGRLTVANGAAGLTAKLRLGLADAELGAIFPSTDRPATSGRLALQTEIEGVGRSSAAFIGSLTGIGTVTLEQARLVGLNPEVFGAVTRAIELGIPTEDNRIREFVGGALDNAGLPVAKASAALEHQRRAGAACATSSSRPTGRTCRRPSTSISPTRCSMLCSPSTRRRRPPALRGRLCWLRCKGTLPAPKRTVDINLLTSWLTLRAVEQQSKQIEAMERAAREAAAAAAAAAPPPKAADPPELPQPCRRSFRNLHRRLRHQRPMRPVAYRRNWQRRHCRRLSRLPRRRSRGLAPRAESVAPLPARTPASPPLLGSQN